MSDRILVRFYDRGWNARSLVHVAAVLHRGNCSWRGKLPAGEDRAGRVDGRWQLFGSAADARRAALAHCRARGLPDIRVIDDPYCC